MSLTHWNTCGTALGFIGRASIHVVTRDVVFFLAPDDETAAATRNSGPGRALRSLAFRFFDPDDAVVAWERYFEAPGQPLSGYDWMTDHTWPRYVAEMLNDGVAVLVVPDELVAELAAAEPEQLRGVAARWGNWLHEQDEHGLSRDDHLEVVRGVAELAAAAGEFRLYCWQS